MLKVLSLDGGGVRGIIPAIVLSHIEKEFAPIHKIFHLVGGTSVGGLLALGLGIGHPASKLRRLLENQSDFIFSKKNKLSLGGWLGVKYSHEPLELILRQLLGETTLADCLPHTFVSTYDLKACSPAFFKSWRFEEYPIEARKLVTLSRATSAAPTYFAPVRCGSNHLAMELVDGGLYVNNPAMCAYAEAKRLQKDKILPDEPIMVVSIGTGDYDYPQDDQDNRQWGKFGWIKDNKIINAIGGGKIGWIKGGRIINAIGDGVINAVDYQMNKLLGDSYYRINIDLRRQVDMDDASQVKSLVNNGMEIINWNKTLARLIKTLQEN